MGDLASSDQVSCTSFENWPGCGWGEGTRMSACWAEAGVWVCSRQGALLHRVRSSPWFPGCVLV